MLLFCVFLLVVATSVQASSRYRYSNGYFVQGNRNLLIPTTNPLRMGLVEGKSWQHVHDKIDERQRNGVHMKLIVFLRHGEGTHNVAIEKYGSEAWNSYYCKLPEYLDAPLTDKGVKQAEETSKKLNAEIGNGLLLQHVLVSPLERALRTSIIAYQNQTTKLSIKSIELPREVLGVDTCDKRRNISEKKLEYREVDFSGFESNEDPWWTPDYRESDVELEIRATKFLDFIFSNSSAKSIGVVSHSVFGAALLRVVGHREYSLGTAELLPLLIENLPESKL
ncbi:unnamed protein product [Peronospora belbahrii]|uniref:Phosphoglycerate mutase n=1 Tax=Peronospora belbahrii TaxID=622444 RepID=A0AAU9LES5_9STRA|nr:unnamed protein product [Peronospora belbahrii]CAH0514006.1 unnamed protein product [Peronospora belbahrii]